MLPIAVASQDLYIYPHSVQKIGDNRRVFLTQKYDTPTTSTITQWLVNCDKHTYMIMEQYVATPPKLTTIKLDYKIRQAFVDTQLWLSIDYVCLKY